MDKLELEWKMRHRVEIRTPSGQYMFGTVVTETPIQDWAKHKKVTVTVHASELANAKDQTQLQHIAFLPDENQNG